MIFGWILSGILIICIGILVYQLKQKQILDLSEQLKVEKEVAGLKKQKETLIDDFNFYEKKIEESQENYRRLASRQSAELDILYEAGKKRRMEELENEMLTQEEKSRQLLQHKIDGYNAEVEKERKHAEEVKEEINQNLLEALQEASFQHEKFESLLAPLQQYEKDRMAKLFYTIQVPDEYKDDIDYLLINVAPKIQHPDIVNKLVWTEYVKPYIDETFKRVGIEAKPGIYKITNIEDGKCYIGKSTDIKKRLADHFKSSIGITSIADQAVHHAILKQGFWNWTIEPIIYCEKDKLNELEKYYIEFFKAQEHGYNKTGGG